LFVGSLLVSFMLVYSAFYAVRILRNWDIQSGSEVQLDLERRTYLISALISYAFGFQLLSLFLFIYTADRLAPLFVGAMCAAGSLHVNPCGYPTVVLKIINFIFAGLWLVLNFTDNRAYDYPLIRKKYAMLLCITPLILMETALQTAYFLGLHPDIITSCCGTLFTSDAAGVTSGIIALPPIPLAVMFYTLMGITLICGIYFYREGKGAYLFSVLSAFTFLVSGVALISFISLYFYELPTHHCPFCLLQKEYLYVGYPLYVAFLGGVVSGMGVGIIKPFSGVVSLKEVVPAIQRRLTLVSLLSYSVSLLIVVYGVLSSNLKLMG
jgi:hypothetical protein